MMGPDFNDDGRVDGYDMEYLNEPKAASGDAGCGDLLKLGCLVPLMALAGLFVMLCCLFFACSAFSGA